MPHAQASTMCYQDLTIQSTNAPDLTPSPWRTTVRLSQACILDGGKVKHALVFWAHKFIFHPHFAKYRPISPFIIYLFLILLIFF